VTKTRKRMWEAAGTAIKKQETENKSSLLGRQRTLRELGHRAGCRRQ
jgi:hypothetical protein